MKFDGLFFVLAVSLILGAARLVWNYANLLYEVEILRKKMGKN